MGTSIPDNTKTRVLIVDNQPALRRVLQAYLRPLGWLNIVGLVSTGQEAIEKSRALAPDIILMSSDLPDMGGLYAVKNILKERPRIQIIICTDQRDGVKAQEAYEAGARGFMWKATNCIELEKAIRCVQNGNQYLDPVFKFQFHKKSNHNEKGSDPDAISC